MMRKLCFYFLSLNLLLLSLSSQFTFLWCDEEFLELVERQTFNYFIECTNKENGLVMDRADNFKTSDFSYAPASVAACGFGLSALVVGAERGWISREEAERITINALKFFKEKIYNKEGFFYHFVDMRTGERCWNCEISSIDTSLFLAGVLLVMEYYENPMLKDMAETIFRRVDFRWMCGDKEILCMGYTPEKGFLPYYWDTYCESPIMYIMAMGSPSFPIDPKSWDKISRPLGRYKDYELIMCPPLFTHQYSHIWIDFRDKNDKFANYFYNSIQATLANREFCIDSSGTFKTYNKDCWGLTAGIGPNGYTAYGAPPGKALCDGTLVTSAAGGSIVFTPNESLSVLKYIYGNFKDKMWGRYGFSDSFNLNLEWFATDAYGINQGPILLMIENFRTGLIWRYFMKNKFVKRGMDLAGFVKSKDFNLNKEILKFDH